MATRAFEKPVDFMANLIRKRLNNLMKHGLMCFLETTRAGGDHSFHWSLGSEALSRGSGSWNRD